MSHQQQIANLPSLQKKMSNDQTMNTEYEFVNLMKESNVGADESFFKSICKMDKGEAPDNKNQENQALLEINEQHLKKIQELQKQILELEEENNALEQEHLVMLKKQDQMGSGVTTENSEMSTMAETKLNMDESQQKVAVKEK